MTRSRLLFLLALVLTAIGLVGHAQAPAASAMPKIEFEKYTLPNGLQVILHVDRKLPIVHVNEWFHVGSKNEKPGRTGFAHLFEHMMFQGSKNATGDYFVYVEKAGANLREGGVNGTTNNDRTNYFATVPSGNLENAALARVRPPGDARRRHRPRRSSTTSATSSRTSAARASRTRPTAAAFKLIFENLYPAGHPYSWPVIGSQEDLTAASLEDVKEFFRHVLHAEQPVARDRRRLRSGRGEAARREVLRRHPAGARARPAAPAGCRRSTARRSSRSTIASRRSASTWRGRRPSTSRRTTRSSTSPRAS